MRTFVALVLLAAGSLVSTPVMAQDLFVSPDVRFKTVQEAQAAMRAAGFIGRFEEDPGNTCLNAVDGRIVELGQVCDQRPHPGNRTSKRGVVQVRVQRQDPRHGKLGEQLEWHLMPDVVGMTEAEALAAMREAGFTVSEQIRVLYIAERNCPIGRVCRTSPSGYSPAGQHNGKNIVIGK